MEKQCVHCGEALEAIFHPTKLKLKKCKKCKHIGDQYIQYHTNLLALQVLLLKKEAYRHIIFNRDLSTSEVVLCLIYFLSLIAFECVFLFNQWNLISPLQVSLEYFILLSICFLMSYKNASIAHRPLRLLLCLVLAASLAKTGNLAMIIWKFQGQLYYWLLEIQMFFQIFTTVHSYTNMRYFSYFSVTVAFCSRMLLRTLLNKS